MSLDWRAGLQGVAQLAVDRVADWCAVHLVAEDGVDLDARASSTPTPRRLVFAKELQERYPPDPANERGAGRGDPHRRVAARAGASRPDAFAAVARDETHERVAARARAALVHLRADRGARRHRAARSRSSRAESGRRYAETDLRAAEELALRAATVVENAQLYEEVEHRARPRARSRRSPTASCCSTTTSASCSGTGPPQR